MLLRSQQCTRMLLFVMVTDEVDTSNIHNIAAAAQFSFFQEYELACQLSQCAQTFMLTAEQLRRAVSSHSVRRTRHVICSQRALVQLCRRNNSSLSDSRRFWGRTCVKTCNSAITLHSAGQSTALSDNHSVIGPQRKVRKSPDHHPFEFSQPPASRLHARMGTQTLLRCSIQPQALHSSRRPSAAQAKAPAVRRLPSNRSTGVFGKREL